MPSTARCVCTICSRVNRQTGKIRSRRGSILVFVVLVCAALLTLSISLLDISGVDLKIAVNQRDSMQAHYLAESGIEAALAMLALHNPFYTGTEVVFLGEGRSSVSVNLLEQQGGGRLVRIISTGSFGVMQEQIVASFQSFPPDPSGTAVRAGSALGWYDAASRLIMPGRHVAGPQESVLMGSATAALLRLPGAADSSGAASFSAAQVFFRGAPSSLVVEEKLELFAMVCVFRGNVLLGQPRGSLHFYHPGGASNRIRVYLHREVTTTEQRLLVRAGVYDFPHNIEITADTDPQKMLEYRVVPVVPGSMSFQGRM